MATGDASLNYVIVAKDRHGREFMHTKMQHTHDVTITNALRKCVQTEVWFVGDVITIEEVISAPITGV